MAENLTGKRRKVNVPVIVGVAVVVVAAVIAGILIHSRQNESSPSGADADVRLTFFAIYSGGGELGGHSSWEITATDGGKAKIVIEEQISHDSRTKTTKRTVSAGVLRQLEAIIDAHGMAGWNDLPESDIFALDAPSTSVSLTIDGQRVSFGGDDELPSGGWAAVREMRAILEEAAGIN